MMVNFQNLTTSSSENMLYFSKKCLEEDLPIKIDKDTQYKYERLDKIYENFFDNTILYLAKVTKNN
jgi:hypothetical protein